MKWLKSYKLFENLEDEINLSDIEDVLVDLKQMDLDYDIVVGSARVIDFSKLNSMLSATHLKEYRGRPAFIKSNEIDNFVKSYHSKNSLHIDIKNEDSTKITFRLDDMEEAYNLISDYLKYEYDLIPNYIYVNIDWSYVYFENFDKIRQSKSFFKKDIKEDEELNYISVNKISFGFWKS